MVKLQQFLLDAQVQTARMGYASIITHLAITGPQPDKIFEGDCYAETAVLASARCVPEKLLTMQFQSSKFGVHTFFKTPLYVLTTFFLHCGDLKDGGPDETVGVVRPIRLSRLGACSGFNF